MDPNQQPRPAPIHYFTNAPQMYQQQQQQQQGRPSQGPHPPHHPQSQPYHMANHLDHRLPPNAPHPHPLPGHSQPLHPHQGHAGPSPPQGHIKWEGPDASNVSIDGDWVDEDSSLGGPGSQGQQGNNTFACPHCDKCYKGKHARSIWRRHLQDKHGIPLSVQPRRTRWDADANRPKNAEERRERMLESKRRWARKKRAQDKAEGRGKASSVMSPDTPGSTPLPPHQGLVPVKQEPDGMPLHPRQPFDPSIATSAHVNAPRPEYETVQSDTIHTSHGAINYSVTAPISESATPAFDANNGVHGSSENSDNGARPWLSTRHSQSSSSSTLRGAFGPVTDMTPDKRRNSREDSGRRPSTASQLSPTSAFGGGEASTSQFPNAATPSRLTAPAAVGAQTMGRSASSGGASNPFSLDHHKISPQERTKPLPPTSLTLPDATGSGSSRMLGLPSPSNVLAELDNSPTRLPSASQGAPLSRDRVLPPLLGTPVRPILKDDGSFLLQSAGRGSAIGDSAIRSSTSRGSRSSHQSRQTLGGSIRGVVGGSSDDEGDLGSSSLMSLSSASRGRMGQYSPSSKSGRRDSLDDGGFDDSGICLSDLTPFHKAIGRQTMGNGGILGLGCGSSVTTPSVMLDSAFPRTVGRPTPLKRSLRADDDGDEDDDDANLGAGNGSPAGRQHKQQRQQRQQRQTQQQQPQHSQFSSPHHPNLAQSLGLAPQSALRSTGPRSLDASTFDFGGMGGIAQSPFQHSSMMGMSLGFTPWEKGSGNNNSLAMAMNGPGGVGAMPNGSPLAHHNSAAAAAAVGSPWPGNFRHPLGAGRSLGAAHDDDDEDEEDYKENQSPLSRAALMRSRARASGLGPASGPANRGGRSQHRLEETPSRPSNGRIQVKGEQLSPVAPSAGSPTRPGSGLPGEEGEGAGMSMGTGLLRFDKLAPGPASGRGSRSGSGNVTPTRPRHLHQSGSHPNSGNRVLGPSSSANLPHSAESSPSSGGGKEGLRRQLSAHQQHQHYPMQSQQQQQSA